MTTANRTLKLRTGNPEDAQTCGKICHEAFKTISEQHNFSSDFPSVDAACHLLSPLFARSDIYSIIAEVGGQIVGSNFLWEETIVAGIGPITVAPSSQNATIGRHLMAAILDRAEQQGFTSVRLVQAAYNNHSLALYTKLGFDVREPLACIQGQVLGLEMPGYPVRLATTDDLADCDRLCQQIHGFDRSRDLRQAIGQGTATVVENDDTIVGYATSIGFLGHAVGKSNEGLKALIGAARSFTGQGFLLPTRNGQLFRWCLQQGLRIVEPMTLMSFGSYNRPTGAFLPSILF
ncbi:GNAT family N-acetyltransferase [Chamaesiphon sp.]|uniref:GNAT family N-acetyltransferase n=1 Tax=Chamaesiphon sp. TaxID=2814140 RepID=UPI0035930058